MWRHARRAAHTVTLLLYCCPLLAVRWMRGACADHLFHALTTRCAVVGFFHMCVLYTLCMRSVCTLYTRSALAARCAFVVNSLASPKSWQKLGAQRRTDLIFHFFIDFQCAGRASRMCDWAIMHGGVSIAVWSFCDFHHVHSLGIHHCLLIPEINKNLGLFTTSKFIFP